MTNQIPEVTLNNGVKMPVLGFGVYQIPAEQTDQAVSDALAGGYRLLDTAEATATRKPSAARSHRARLRATSSS